MNEAVSTGVRADGAEGPGTVRVAAVGDLHVRAAARGLLRAGFADLADRADLLLLAGDLTDNGLLSEAHALADELHGLGLPIVAVLGNHDREQGQESQIKALLSVSGITVLDGTSTVVQARGIRVGVAGTVGFDGGFGRDFDLWSAVREGKRSDRRLAEAERFAAALAGLRSRGADICVALTHYSPSRETLLGEPGEILACLGNALLGWVIDQAGVDLAVHGHAHFGTEHGATRGGVPVRNVARPVLGRPYTVYRLTRSDSAAGAG